jgi:aspartate/methionine/tyrosine aminotransferase
MALSSIDSVIATEALSDRCKPQILARHLDIAQSNIALLDAFVESHKGLCEWVRPAAGGTGFIRFLDGDRRPVDDVVFCKALKEKKEVLLAPGSLCFGTRGAEDFQGYVRVHITVDPGVMEKSLVAIGEFLDESTE